MSVRGAVRRATQWIRGYTWDAGSARYRNLKTGGFVARKTIMSKLEDSLNQRETSIVRHVQELADGKLRPNTYLALEKRMIKQQALQQAALNAGGWDRMTPSDRGRVGAMLQQAYKSQAGIVKGLADGTVSLPQALQRTHMAMGNVRRVGLEIGEAHRGVAKPNMVWIALRTLGQAEHCPECLAMADAGWQLADDVPVPGDASSCDGSCRCERDIKMVPETELSDWIGTRH